MPTWTLKLRDLLRVNFWLIPSVMVLGAVALSFLMLAIDARFDGHSAFLGLGWKFTSGTDGARQILATIASSMITITSITFSLTIVALQLASSQFGPRLLRNFMADRGTQVVLGTFISTFTYSLLILRSIHTEDDQPFVPHYSLLLAVLFALAALGVLIYFIHHTATAIQADQVIKHVSAELRQSLETLFPEQVGQAARSPRDAAAPRWSVQHAVSILSPRSDYLQAIETDALLKIATEHDLVLRVEQRPGRFLLEGVLLAYAWPPERIDDALGEHIGKTFVFGGTRSPFQDAEFAVDQLVEIAVRALSSGINDPFTAITCVDRLSEALLLLSKRAEPASHRADEQGTLRIVSSVESFAGIAEACFNQIRQAAEGIPAVSIRILQRIGDLAPHVESAAVRQVLSDQVTMIQAASGQRLVPGKDLQDIEQHCLRAAHLLHPVSESQDAGAHSDVGSPMQ
jgi:uncharacterized membrane protein